MRPRTISRPAFAAGAALALMVTAAPTAFAQEPPGVVIRGVVLDPAGAPLPDAAITITALRPMDAAPVGGSYSDDPLAVATSRADGSFSLALTGPFPDLAEFASTNNGFANFWLNARKILDVATSPGLVPANGTVYSTADLLYLAVDETGVPETVTGEGGEAVGVADLVVLETTASALVNSVLTSGISDSECSPTGRGEWTVEGRDVYWEPFGQIHTGWDTSLRIEYGKHANTDLSGAYKVGGGSWKATSGYAHMGNEAEIIEASYSEYRGTSVLTKFKYVLERFDFRNSASSAPCYTEHRIRPEGWQRDSLMDGIDRYNESTWADLIKSKENKVIGEFKEGTKWVKKTGRGRKMTVEVQAFGVGLSAQSTWSAQIDVFYTFGSGTKRHHYIYHPTRSLSDAPAIYAW